MAATAHLIEGTLAEQLRLDVLASECVPVGALGGKTSWSEFGAYTVTLGPDMNGECHELEMQGIPAITSVIPEVDLQELWDGALSVLPRGTQLPTKIGGTNAQILVGIKSTHLGPKLIHTSTQRSRHLRVSHLRCLPVQHLLRWTTCHLHTGLPKGRDVHQPCPGHVL